MRKIIRYLLLVVLSFICIEAYSQTTIINGSYTSGEKECGRLKSVEIQKEGVVVTIEVKALKKLDRLRVFSTENTFIKSGNLKLLQLSGILINNEVKGCGTNTNWGWNNVPAGETRTYKLYFSGVMPSGVTNFSMQDEGDFTGMHGYGFSNYTITNPRTNYIDFPSEFAVRQNIDNSNDGICGIYEPINAQGANLACVKYGGEYKLIYLSSPESYILREIWKLGDIKANLRQTASGIMKADWYDALKRPISSAYIYFDGISFKVSIDGQELMYLKTYPTTPSSNVGSGNSGNEWTGTGFALKNGYIITNNHVVEEAKSILVLGVNGDHTTEFKATVIATDKKNDLSLIQITDSRFRGFNDVPYSVANGLCDVGEDVFVLGYPLTTYMGEEIKLTNGIISSRTGYQGDITTYQISAPVQPGNSGGPLFDRNGNIVGVVNAGIPGADNVGYAIKSSYLFSLVSSVTSTSNIPQTNHIVGKSLPEMVKAVKDYVFFIKCK